MTLYGEGSNASHYLKPQSILAGEHARQGLREMLLKTPERGAVPELVYRYPQIAMHLPQKAVSPFVQNDIKKTRRSWNCSAGDLLTKEAPQRPTTGPHDTGVSSQPGSSIDE